MESRTVRKNICFRMLPAIFLAFVLMFAMQMLVFAAANEGDTITVTKDGGCNVRKSASTDSDKAGAADKGQSFTVAEVVEAGDYVWYRVESDSVSGYIRGDMVEVTATAEETPSEEEVPEEGEVTEEETTEEAAPPASSSATLNALEPTADPDVIPEGFVKVTLNTGAGSVTGWQNGNYYIIYAQTLGGDPGWYLLDATDSSDMIWIRYNSSLFTAASTAKTSSGNGYLIMAIVFGVLCVVLIIVVVILGMKQFGGNNNSYDDDDDDDDDDYDDDDDDDEEDERPARRPASKGTTSSRHPAASSRPVVPAGRQGSRQSSGSAYPQGNGNGRVRRADPSRRSLATAQKPSNIPDDDYDEDDYDDDYNEDLSETKVMPSKEVVERRSERRPEGGQVRTQARRSQPVSRSSAGRSVQGGAQRRSSAQYSKSKVRNDEDDE